LLALGVWIWGELVQRGNRRAAWVGGGNREHLLIGGFGAYAATRGSGIKSNGSRGAPGWGQSPSGGTSGAGGFTAAVFD